MRTPANRTKPGSVKEQKREVHRADAASETAKPGSLRKKIVVAFVAFHLFVIALFSIPLEKGFIETLRVPFKPYVICLGMTESWRMFAPNPKSSEQFFKAVVMTAHGRSEVYSFPRMEDLSYSERYREERYRKFQEEVVCSECSGLWPDIEKRVARLKSTPSDPADRVILVKFESRIDPKTGLTGDDAQAVPSVLSELFLEPEDRR